MHTCLASAGSPLIGDESNIVLSTKRIRKCSLLETQVQNELQLIELLRIPRALLLFQRPVGVEEVVTWTLVRRRSSLGLRRMGQARGGALDHKQLKLLNPPVPTDSRLGCIGCRSKVPQTGGLNKRKLLSHSYGAASPRSGCGQARFLLRPLPSACRSPSSPFVSTRSFLCVCPRLLSS